MSNYLQISDTILWENTPRMQWRRVLVRLAATIGVLAVCWALYSLMASKPAVHGGATDKRVATMQ
jgi:hypothetical protein